MRERVSWLASGLHLSALHSPSPQQEQAHLWMEVGKEEGSADFSKGDKAAGPSFSLPTKHKQGGLSDSCKRQGSCSHESGSLRTRKRGRQRGGREFSVRALTASEQIWRPVSCAPGERMIPVHAIFLRCIFQGHSRQRSLGSTLSPYPQPEVREEMVPFFTVPQLSKSKRVLPNSQPIKEITALGGNLGKAAEGGQEVACPRDEGGNRGFRTSTSRPPAAPILKDIFRLLPSPFPLIHPAPAPL